MGKELKREIAKHGGRPLNDEDMTEAEIIEAGFKAYEEIGEIPPIVKDAINKIEKKKKTDNS